jgi:hypothetical protein
MMVKYLASFLVSSTKIGIFGTFSNTKKLKVANMAIQNSAIKRSLKKKSTTAITNAE